MEFYAITEPLGKVGKTYPLIFQPRVPLDDPFDCSLVEGRVRPEGPLELIREAGSGHCDFHHIRHMGGYVVSHRFCEALRNFNCSGWSTYPVVARDRKGTVLADLEGLVVTGRASRLDRAGEKRIEVRDPLGFTRSPWVGYQIVDSSWDGSDVFLTAGPNANTGLTVFLSSRGADALRSEGLVGFTVERVPDVQWLLRV